MLSSCQILCRKIGGSTCVFDAQAVCNSLHGLRNMSNEHEEVYFFVKQ